MTDGVSNEIKFWCKVQQGSFCYCFFLFFCFFVCLGGGRGWVIVYLKLYQGCIQDSRISGMGVFTKINTCFKLVFEESSILYIWLNPKSTSDFSGCKFAIKYYFLFDLSKYYWQINRSESRYSKDHNRDIFNHSSQHHLYPAYLQTFLNDPLVTLDTRSLPK